MAEEKKDPSSAECCASKHGRCGGCKFLAGILIGLLLAGTGFGLYMAGRGHHGCHFMHGMCPLSGQPQGSK